MREKDTDLLPSRDIIFDESHDIILSKRKRILRGPGGTEFTRHSSLL